MDLGKRISFAMASQPSYSIRVVCPTLEAPQDQHLGSWAVSVKLTQLSTSPWEGVSYFSLGRAPQSSQPRSCTNNSLATVTESAVT